MKYSRGKRMEKGTQFLKDVGADADKISLYQRYLDAGNKQGQERVLCRCRRSQNEKLKSDREKLARLDYMIAKVEKDF